MPANFQDGLDGRGQKELARAERLLALVKAELLEMRIDVRLEFVTRMTALLAPEIRALKESGLAH